MGDTRQVRTFCRICEPSCGLVATIEGGRLAKLAPDREHPITQGFACHKGLAAVDVHHDPDRLDHPMLRDAAGEWLAASWDAAMAHTAQRLRTIVEAHGPDAIGAYIGNPTAFNALGSLHLGALLKGLGIRRTFSSGTQDCANKFVASEAVFGSSNVHPIPDIDRTDLCLVIGENPRASQASFWSIPNVLGAMRRNAARGCRFVFVNPRRVETPDRGIGDTLLIRPDTDVWFLSALLNEIDRLGGFDDAVLAQHATRVAELRSFISAYPADRVAAATGVSAEQIRELAAAWVSTPRASVHASTGLNMGRQGTLAYWLVHMLTFVTGRLDAEGGNLKSDGFYPNARSGKGATTQAYVDTEFGSLRRGALPGVLMADHILDAQHPIRAMIVAAGNPLLSIGGEARLAKALAQLELLVVIDIYPNATSEHAHVMLPCTDMYERDDLNVVNIGTSARPFAQYTPAVVAAAHERRPEWWIAHRLLQEMERPSLLDDAEPDPWAKYRHMLERGAGLSLDGLMAGEPVVTLAAPEPGRFFDDQVQTEDGRVDCCPPAFDAAIERCHALFAQCDQSVDGSLLLIHRRDAWMHNSWFANVERMKRHDRTTNPLWMHRSDMERLQLSDGDEIEVASDWGAITANVATDDDLMPGVVSMAHGWGHRLSPRLRVAHDHPGSNPNALLPHGPGAFEPLSSQAHMTGVPVRVRALSGQR
jgi:anaerobic selenocysteine-containing dehydrogenase